MQEGIRERLRNAEEVLLVWFSIWDSFEEAGERVGEEHREDELHYGGRRY